MFNQYWTDKEVGLLETAVSFSELKDIAFVILERMGGNIVQVCGPISTGGLGSVEKNINLFNKTINSLTEKGENVFDQTPFENSMYKIKKENPCEGYNFTLLEEFYLPIFESGVITKLYFLPDWLSSVGSRWEYEQARRLGIKTISLD